MITDEELAELPRLIVSDPTARVIAKAVKACKPPRAPKAPPRVRDRHEARLRAGLTRYRNRVNALAAARAAIAAARGTKQESYLRFDAIDLECTEHSDATALKQAEADLAAYLARKQATPA